MYSKNVLASVHAIKKKIQFKNTKGIILRSLIFQKQVYKEQFINFIVALVMYCLFIKVKCRMNYVHVYFSNDCTELYIFLKLTLSVSLTSVSNTINCQRDNCTKLQETNE